METEDTSQMPFCKKALLSVTELMRQVNDYGLNQGPRPKLQNSRLFETARRKEVLVLDFYPLLKDLAFVWSEGEVRAIGLDQLDRSALAPKKHPLILYLKAHFVGYELRGMTAGGVDDRVLFDFGDRRVEWDFAKRECRLAVDGKKDYLQRLPEWADFESVKKNEASAADAIPKIAVPKPSKLVANVENDLATARQWLKEHEEKIRHFLNNPVEWGNKKSLPPWGDEWIAKLNSLNVPAFKVEHRKTALEALKKILGRQLRKVEKASERLLSVKRASVAVVPRAQPGARKKVEQEKTLGSHVKISDDLEVVVGRKAVENDQLYRQAQSRDLWFHVRGQKSGHVWLRRGQKGFGAKDTASEKIIREAATLAVRSSKIRGAWIAVDYTERRHLKKRKGGNEGELVVLKSKTIFVSLEK